MPKVNLFSKIVGLFIIMLLPIIGLYSYSNHISTEVLDSELNRSNTNQLVFFQNQVNSSIDLLGLWPNLLIQDPDIANLRDYYIELDNLDLPAITMVKRIQTKLSIQESSSNWKSNLAIYSPTLARVITVNDAVPYNKETLADRLKHGWQVKPLGDEGFRFSLMTALPYNNLSQATDTGLLIEVSFDSSNIQGMLDQFKRDGRRDPFYYNEEWGTIYNRTADQQLGNRLIAQLDESGSLTSGSHTVKVNEERYLVNIVRSETIGWDLIDYIPLSDVLQPINQTNRLFYYSVGLLLLMSCLIAYMLYAQVQVPIKQLVVSFQKLKNGDYGVRLTPKGRGNNEFKFVFIRFNLMVQQIQDLFENVYLEKIHVREARLKQLQSQINPHFFYNCFSFISSMAKLENYQSVIAMSQNLSNYYRYTTRQERDLVDAREEIDFVRNYLDIQQMRMSRLSYELDIPEHLLRFQIPPLVIQPLVENAVIHGIEQSPNAGRIRISGEFDGEFAAITVEDDGVGLSPERLFSLQYQLTRPMEQEMGCGLWNVHQRLHLRFGACSGIVLSPSTLGGLKVQIRWNVTREKQIEQTTTGKGNSND
ncbi:sensor histidine kinase [Paenibacillus sp. FSL H8-0537]|uniref:sensor histidine kinase n=1 Tax=Paenibacillus sp. FSL H8-0537 TaxID=2921399 RepID=UPI0031018702